MINIVHVGDVHLGRTFRFVNYDKLLIEKRREAIWISFENVLRYADENADFLIFTGDLFDSADVDHHHLSRVVSLFSKYSNVRIVIIPGNHDESMVGTLSFYLEECTHVFLMSELSLPLIEFPHERIRFHYMNHATSLSKTKEWIDVGLFHGDWNEIHEATRLQYDYLALGHIHQPTQLSYNAWYPGILEPGDFGELGAHGWVNVTFSNTMTTEFISASIGYFHTLKVDVTNALNIVDIIDRVIAKRHLMPQTSSLYLRVDLVGEHQLDQTIEIDGIREHLAGLADYVEVRNLSQNRMPVDYLQITSDNTIVGEFIRSMRELDKDPLAMLALDFGLHALLKDQNNEQNP